MKNLIFIDVDTDREKPVVFGKPPDSTPPQTPEEAGAMIINDIACISEAITTLIRMASQNGYADKNDLVNAVVKTVYQALDETQNKTEGKTELEDGHQEQTERSIS
jgi:hypothetical protein